ncbi:hypothetical protein [Salinibacterium sp. ZJ70]|uniref:hypothetical protein n=1 Tax=Salinibacterium sp. ZJ70 TaxID=2708084 RepID=UPI001CD1C9CF|nr:hypothetical protein [Salinibacterium sp. ZJ70]
MAAREPEPASARRITLNLTRGPLHATFGVRPTVVIDGRTEPSQWGVGTWQVPDDRPVEVTVFLFSRGLRFGRRTALLHPEHSRLDYRAPILPFLPARLIASA